MQLLTKEHYDLMDEFEKDCKLLPYSLRLNREKDKEWWKQGQIYEDGKTNDLFLAYRLGYSFGRAKHINN